MRWEFVTVPERRGRATPGRATQAGTRVIMGQGRGASYGFCGEEQSKQA